MNTKVLAAGMLGAAVLAGCTALPKSAETCAATDWKSVGYEDGLNGERAARVEYHSTACEGRFDAVAYNEGRSEGLVGYCTPENGYSEGSRQRAYYGVCPADLHPAFVKEYERGLAYARRPRIGIGVGIGSGGRSRVGVGVGFPIYYGHRGYYDDDYYDPFWMHRLMSGRGRY